MTKIIWLITGCLMVTALLLASCAPAAQPTTSPTPTSTSTPITTSTLTPTLTAGPEMIKVKLTKLDGTVVEKQVEKPKYGGTATVFVQEGPVGFDEAFLKWADGRANRLTDEPLFIGDWARGPAGTNEASWLYAGLPEDLRILTGAAGESWEMTDPETFVLHVRKGVHFQNKPPTNGREMDANDVVYSLTRLLTTPTSGLSKNYPPEVSKLILQTIKATDKWTVTMKVAPGMVGVFLQYTLMRFDIVPHEAIEKYGDMRKWENVCGIGPFMITDYLSMSSVTFAKNPDYWAKDPITGMQLPYVDTVKWLIIPDAATALAAMRTDKVDRIMDISLEDLGGLIRTNPKLKYIKVFQSEARLIAMRTDTKPFDDVRVRQALHMAVDFQGIVKDYYQGDAEALCWPIPPLPDYAAFYTPMDKLPQSVQELFSHNTDKAKQLLAEAGYPNGFKAEVLCWAPEVDMMSIIKNNFSKIGVDLSLDVKEHSVYLSIVASKTFKSMTTNMRTIGSPFTMGDYRTGTANNASLVVDARANKTYDDTQANFFNPDEKNRIMREWVPYCLEQAWYIAMPQSYSATCWEPWLKNFSGESSVGYSARDNWVYWAWVDQELKKEMLGTR